MNMKPKNLLRLALCLPFGCLNGAEYYLDAMKGSNLAAGNSPTSAWQSVDKINSSDFLPGDVIYLKSGQSFRGQIKPLSSGSAQAKITLKAYGHGPKPHLKAAGEHAAALKLEDLSYWTIEGLEITNTGPTPKAGRHGVHVVAREKVVRSITLRGLFIHDVNGVFSKEEGGGTGIKWQTQYSQTAKARFDDLLIEDCHLLRCDRDGIKGGTATPWDLSNLSTAVVIRNNMLEDIGGDGIVPIGSDGAIVEYNRIYGARTRIDLSTNEKIKSAGASVGIWPWSANNSVFRYNEVWGYRGSYDGQGFDSDYNCDGTLFEYNFSADNAGGFFLICNDPKHLASKRSIGNLNTTIRYNISFNDHRRIFNIQGAPAEGLTVTRNIIYNTKVQSLPLVLVINEQEPKGANISENLFYTLADPKVGIGRWQGQGLYGYKKPFENQDHFLKNNHYVASVMHEERGKKVLAPKENLVSLIKKASDSKESHKGFFKLLNFLKESKHYGQINAAMTSPLNN